MTEKREIEIAIRGDEWASTKTADRGGYYFAGLSEGYYNGYLEAIKELQEQNEKMKNCWNCANWNWKHSKCQKKLKGDCFKASKWKLREN